MSLDSTEISILEATYRRSASYPGQSEINSEIPNGNPTFHLAVFGGSWVCLQSFSPKSGHRLQLGASSETRLRRRRRLADVPWDGAARRGSARGFRAHSGGHQRITRRPSLRGSLPRSPPPRAARPASSGDPRLQPHPGPPTYVTGEGKGSSLEGPISQDWKSVRVKASRQPAAIFAIEDQCPPCLPGGGGAARGEGPSRGADVCRRARGERRAGQGTGGPAGRGRADSLARGCRSVPRLPRLRRHQGRLWKRSSASLPAPARSGSPRSPP